MPIPEPVLGLESFVQAIGTEDAQGELEGLQQRALLRPSSDAAWTERVSKVDRQGLPPTHSASTMLLLSLDQMPEAGQRAGPPAGDAAAREGAWGATAKPRTASRRFAVRAGRPTEGMYSRTGVRHGVVYPSKYVRDGT